jgi:hypothetical protein
MSLKIWQPYRIYTIRSNILAKTYTAVQAISKNGGHMAAIFKNEGEIE